MLLIYSYFTFLSSIKAILVRCAHRLLSKLARIFANLADRLTEGKTLDALNQGGHFKAPQVFSLR